MSRIPISTHLHEKPYQVAASRSKTLPKRKWKHKGTIWAVSALSAAYQYRGDKMGYGMTRELGEGGSSVFGFPDGEFVMVSS